MKNLVTIAFAICFSLYGAATSQAQTWFWIGDHACRERTVKDRPFFDAIKRSDAPRIKALLRKGVDPNLTDDCHIGAVNYAVHRLRPEILKIFVEANADLNAIDGFHHQPLLFWILKTSDEEAQPADIYESLRLLIDHGADVNLRGKSDCSALIEAVRKNKPDIVLLFLVAGAEVDFRDDENRTAYSYAAEDGFSEIKKILFNAGADTKIGVEEYVKTYAENAFFQAAADGRTDVVEAMLAGGMDVNAVNAGNMTALMRATKLSTVDSLLEAGAKVDHRDNAGFTALHWAAAFNRKEILSRLIAAGADLSARTADGKTALDLTNRPEVKRALLDAGARDRSTK